MFPPQRMSSKPKGKRNQSRDPRAFAPRSLNNIARFPTVGFPNKLIVRHKYVENVGLTSTTGALNYNNFSCNGMYDPNITGTGHQPMYFDTLTGIYNHYTVVASSIRVTFNSNVNTNTILVGIMQNDDSVITPTSASALAEQYNARILSVAQTDPNVITMSWTAVGTFGGDPLSNDNLQGTVSTNPPEQTVWTIFAQSADLISTIGCNALVELEYTAVWEELKDLTQQ